ncbi:hypothetical protein V8F20_009647 [Naviculisporaceae sp. PSN 640]
MRSTQLLSILLCGGSVLASPLVKGGPVLAIRANGEFVTAQTAIEYIMPNSTSCEGATDECRTAAQAAPFLIEAMDGFSLGQIGAMLALIAVESAEMKFKHNVFPGVPGQGTSNMMSPKQFVKSYAIDKLGQAAVEGKSDADVLALVQPDEYNFGSAPWFLRTQCTKEVQDGLLGGTQAGWEAYMGCIGVPPTDDPRPKYWKAAQEIFNLNGLKASS